MFLYGPACKAGLSFRLLDDHPSVSIRTRLQSGSMNHQNFVTKYGFYTDPAMKRVDDGFDLEYPFIMFLYRPAYKAGPAHFERMDIEKVSIQTRLKSGSMDLIN